MEDLSGLDWSNANNGTQKKPPMNPPSMGYRPSPSPFNSQPPSQSPFASGRSTPLQPQTSSSSGSKQHAANAKPAQDSFSNLMKFGPTKSNQNLSLAERQQQLEAEKRKKLEEQAKFNASQGQFWDTLGSRGTTPSQAAKPNGSVKNDDDDLFAAFNKDTEVDNATHFPPNESRTSTPASAKPLDLSDPSAWNAAGASKPAEKPMTTLAPTPIEDDDDDPFGLNQMKQPSSQQQTRQVADDDDFLGDLGRPVEEVRQKQAASQPSPAPGKPIDDDSSSDEEPTPRRQPQRQQSDRRAPPADDAFDRAVAQLMDYGFAPDDARRGLTESGAGTNVQAAANWLLDDAHRKAKAKASGRPASPTPPAQPGRQHNKSPAGGEPDFAKTAASVGNSLFKTANSLWKTGQKRINQAVADLQQEGAADPSQPKWLRDAQQGQTREERAGNSNATDEALALDAGRPQPQRTNSRQHTEQRPSAQRQQSRTEQPSSSRQSPVPRWQQSSAPPAMFDSKAKLRKLEVDDDLSTYSSPNRRRRQPAPAKPKEPEPEPDLLFGGSEAPKPSQQLPERPAPQRSAPPAAKRPTPKPSTPVRPAPNRQIPAIAPDALQRSTKLRHEGTAHFKRGDYASAHSSYSSSLNAVPSTHPLAILLLTNRALTALKTGEPKQAVEDADAAIKLIGPSNGTGETIAVKSETGADENRDMRDVYGKALSRKAEALEQMERWSDAGLAWAACVEAGLGGANAIKGRQRCQNAIAPKPAPRPVAKARPKPSASASLATAKDSEAVTRMREANAAAAKEDDEKFALADAVDAKIAAWRDGKRDNLRALLGSLDNVLWEGSGWKKVGLHELVQANKVKIAYMKAIAKTHPDKVSTPCKILSIRNTDCRSCPKMRTPRYV